MNFEKKSFDVIIIGGGVAGLSAALWCDELGLSTLLLEKKNEFGGQLLRVYNPIKNHLGVETKNGCELRDIFVRQTDNRKFFSSLRCEVAEIDFENKKVFLKFGEEIFWRFLVVATGISRRRLNLEGEDFFDGKGILKSGQNQQETVRNKSVLVIGGGDAALENSLILAETAEKVFLIHRRSEFRGRTEFITKIENNPKIKVILETVIEKINGRKEIESVDIKNLSNSEKRNLKIEHILIRIGVEPNTSIFRKKLRFDKSGYIKVNQFCETNIENVFAVGDVANPISPTVSTAVGMGAAAAKAIRMKAGSD